MMTGTRKLLVGLACLALVACSGFPAPATGQWGGSGLYLVATKHTTTLNLSCLSFTGGPLWAEGGRFRVNGSTVARINYPSAPATMVGRLSADTIFLAVATGSTNPDTISRFLVGIQGASATPSGVLCAL